MNNPFRKIVTYMFVLALGACCGFIAGGEVIRAIYGLQPLFSGKDAVRRAVMDSAGVPDTAGRQSGMQSGRVQFTRNNAIVQATRTVAPCVVGIVVTQIQVVRPSYSSNDFFDFFFGPEMMPRYRQVESMGSGFIIRNDGMILTNYHVIENAAKLYVNFSDGRRIEGFIVGVDEQSDLAVISVKGGEFRSVRFGDSEKAIIGEWAIAIGNPFLNFINDAHPTVTVGVVSAIDRNFTPSEGVYYQGMIQTDAAINPGNSGGPLVNADGEVIGINTFIYTGSNNNKGSIGIGFAIPINRVRRVAEEIFKYGHRREFWTGIAVQDLTRQLALALGADKLEGVVVVNVDRASPAEKAGLKNGDIILQMGNRRIESHSDIDGLFLDYFVGDAVSITILRKGAKLQLSLVLSQVPGRLSGN